VNLQTILDLIAERQTSAQHNADRLREQIATLTAELVQIDTELSDLATTRSTLRTLAAAEFTADEPTVISSAYQQILAVLSTAPPACAPRTSASPLASNPHRNTSKAPARS
jgi:prefoldin subunit 5